MARHKQEQYRLLKQYSDKRLEHLRRHAEFVDRCVFEADLEMGRLARMLEEKGFVARMFLPVQPSHHYYCRKKNGKSLSLFLSREYSSVLL